MFIWCGFVMYSLYNMLITRVLNAYVYMVLPLKRIPRATTDKHAQQVTRGTVAVVVSRAGLRLLAVLERVESRGALTLKTWHLLWKSYVVLQ